MMRANWSKTSRRTFNLYGPGASASAKFTISDEGTWLTLSGQGALKPERGYSDKLPAALDFYTLKLVYGTMKASEYAARVEEFAPELRALAEFLRAWEVALENREPAALPVPPSGAK